MDRKEFCEMLVKIRKEAGYNRDQYSIKAKMTPNQLYRIENACHNFSFDKVTEYLFALQKGVFIHRKSKKFVFLNADQFANWLPSVYEEIGSRNALATKIGYNPSAFYFINKKTVKTSIDMFLKIVEALGYTVTIEDL